jgi:hypothetical protein
MMKLLELEHTISKGSRTVIGGLIGFFGSGILLAIVFFQLKTEPCQLAQQLQCHVLSGRQFYTFSEFLSDQYTPLMWILGSGFGLLGGAISA